MSSQFTGPFIEIADFYHSRTDGRFDYGHAHKKYTYKYLASLPIPKSNLG